MTKKNRPTYSTEFKHEAASLVLDKNYSITEATRAMGVSNSALNRWVKQLESERAGKTPNSKAFTEDQRKVQELEARLKQIEWENDILKKATALLMSGNIKR